MPKIVLVVDDDPDQLVLVATVLGKNGYSVHTAPNPVHALALLENLTVDLVVTDLMMPHTDGIAFTEKLHAMPQHKNVPVIMMTAYGTDEIADKGMRRGVALTLSKPVELSKLLDLVGFATH